MDSAGVPSGNPPAAGDARRIRRFLVLGSLDGCYRARPTELTRNGHEPVLRVARQNGEWLAGQVCAVAASGRAARPEPALFALAAVSALADVGGRKAALAVLPAVCRSAEELFRFAGYVEQFRGWGRGLRRAVAGWYLDRDVEELARYTVTQRRQHGWSHRDLLRLAHPTSADPARRALFGWLTSGVLDERDTPPLIRAYVSAKAATAVADWVRLVEQAGLTWAMLPDAALAEPAVWRALLERGLAPADLLVQLPRLTRLGVLCGETLSGVLGQLAGPAAGAPRLTPVDVLAARRGYTAAPGRWTPIPQVVDALDVAYRRALDSVAPAGRRTLVAIELSAAMAAPIGSRPVQLRDAAATLALAALAGEPATTVLGFTGQTGLVELGIDPGAGLDDAVRALSGGLPGPPDAALPIRWARHRGAEYDTFLVCTAQWPAGDPLPALAGYRERTGRPARLVEVGLAVRECAGVELPDPDRLIVAGFDRQVPRMVADFARGEL